MNKHIFITLLLLLTSVMGIKAQRAMDVLDRGLVAVKSTTGVFCSWRITGDEWYDVKYNIYRDGTKLNDTPLSVSNFTDPAGTSASTYTVAAVFKGHEAAKCAPVKVLEKNYMVIQPKHDPTLTSVYVPNDACCADVDGDGQVEILMKYDNQSEINASYPYGGNNGEYSLFECLKLDGTVLWWVNCGPNMGDFQNNEQNIVGYDWDGDGKAEVVFRAADGTTIHMANGEVYTVGDASINYRGATGGGANWFLHSGREYLLYVNGLTGEPYQCIDYPLPRLEDDENPNGLLSGSAYDGLVNTAWGDGYGHRSTKHFFGAPYLDGRRPSIFLARGIYTRHKMIAYDVDPETHQLVERWRWNNSTHNEWFGQGYHNYSIADVDWDGRDEIVFGSMVIDDNGLGLSTTGLGHGDSHHVGDFDPYTHGQEIFACNEDEPNNNYRDATTSKIYYRTTGGNDDGRANMGNFIDEYPGAQGVSSRDPNLIGGASHAAIVGDNKSTVTITQNFRIYWDGDLCDETFDYSNGKNTAGGIYKARQGRIALLEGSKTNNDTKGTPCYQGDIFGDWREEVIMRDANNNIRIYTTDIPTTHRIYTLWHDHQYRNAMVWQMCGYNQTPHVSYYIGEYEGITVPPAPLTMTGRTEIANNATIGHESDGKHIIICENNDMQVSVADGAAPYILTVNTPTWVQGHNSNNNITTTTYTHILKDGALTGEMRLVKQGDGILVMPNTTHTYTGETEVWAGTFAFDGKLQGSHLWLNRHATLSSAGGSFDKGISMHYGSTLRIGADSEAQTVTTTDLELSFGSVLEIDLFSDGIASDKVVATTLKIEKKDWTNGPEYSTPILRLVDHPAAGETNLATGLYLIGEIGAINGNLDDLLIIGLDNLKKTLVYEDGKLYIDIKNFDTGAKTWMGTESNIWDIDNALNFTDGTGAANAFYPGDEITFDDSATITDIVINENLMPAALTFANVEKNYTLSGEGSIVGATSLVKNGAGKVTINNANQYTGGTFINEGTIEINTYANAVGTEYGALGRVSNPIKMANGAVLSATATGTMGNRVSIVRSNATINVATGSTLTLEHGITQSTPGQTLYKSGGGALTLASDNSFTKLVINGGTINASENASSVINLPATVEFVNGTLNDPSNIYTYSTNPAKFVVEEGNLGVFYLDGRCNYTGSLTGGGTLTVYATSVRNYLQGNWSAFTGTINAGMNKIGSYDPTFFWSNAYGLPNATLNIMTGCYFNAENNPLELGNLKGAGTIYCTNNITVGSINKDYSYSGKFEGNPTLTKVGSGDWRLAKLISGAKKVMVKGGYLSLAGSNENTNVCEVPIELSDSALMRGRGTVTTLTVKDGAVLEPGYYSSSNSVHFGAIYVKGDLTAEAGSLISFYIRKSDNAANSRSYLVIDGQMSVNGKIKVTIDPSYAPKVGDAIKLWVCGSYSGSCTYDLPALPEGLDWDITGLQDGTGIIKVIEAAGISSIEASAEVTAIVYNTNGTECGRILTTRGQAVQTIRRELRLQSGVYLIRFVSANSVETIKVVL